jgi:hypothetical protein
MLVGTLVLVLLDVENRLVKALGKGAEVRFLQDLDVL